MCRKRLVFSLLSTTFATVLKKVVTKRTAKGNHSYEYYLHRTTHTHRIDVRLGIGVETARFSTLPASSAPHLGRFVGADCSITPVGLGYLLLFSRQSAVCHRHHAHCLQSGRQFQQCLFHVGRWRRSVVGIADRPEQRHHPVYCTRHHGLRDAIRGYGYRHPVACWQPVGTEPCADGCSHCPRTMVGDAP